MPNYTRIGWVVEERVFLDTWWRVKTPVCRTRTLAIKIFNDAAQFLDGFNPKREKSYGYKQRRGFARTVAVYRKESDET